MYVCHRHSVNNYSWLDVVHDDFNVAWPGFRCPRVLFWDERQRGCSCLIYIYFRWFIEETQSQSYIYILTYNKLQKRVVSRIAPLITLLSKPKLICKCSSDEHKFQVMSQCWSDGPERSFSLSFKYPSQRIHNNRFNIFGTNKCFQNAFAICSSVMRAWRRFGGGQHRKQFLKVQKQFMNRVGEHTHARDQHHHEVITANTVITHHHYHLVLLRHQFPLLGHSIIHALSAVYHNSGGGGETEDGWRGDDTLGVGRKFCISDSRTRPHKYTPTYSFIFGFLLF